MEPAASLGSVHWLAKPARKRAASAGGYIITGSMCTGVPTTSTDASF